MSGSNSGLFGMDPETARNLLMFGASTMAAANARTPQGFLAYGAGALGPIGAGLMGMNDQAMQQAKLRSELGYQGAQTQDIQNRNWMFNLQKPYISQSMADIQNGGSGVPQMAPMPNAGPIPSGATLPTIPRDNTQTAGMQAHNPENLMYAGQSDATGTISLPGGRNLAAFPDNQTGIAAAAKQLMINQDQHGANSVRDQVTRWVNDPKADLSSYIADTARALKVNPDAPVNWHDPNVQMAFLQAQYPHESAGGRTSLQPSDVQAGVQRAGGAYQIAQAGNGPLPSPGRGGAPQPQSSGNQTLPSSPYQEWLNRADQADAAANNLEYQRSIAAQRQKMFPMLPIAMPPGDPQALRQMAQTYRQNALQYQNQQAEPRTGRGPGSFVVTPNGVIQAPLEYTIVGPDQRKYRITQNAVETGDYVRPPGIPDWAPRGTLSISAAELAPGEHTGAEDAAKDDFGEKARAQYASALGTRRAMEDLDQQFDQLNAAGPGWYNTGQGADWKLGLGKAANALSNSAGAGDWFDANKLASGEDILKQSKLAGMQTLATFFGGSKEAASIVKSTQGAVPNLENTPMGGKLVLHGIDEAARWEMDQHAFMANWYFQHKGNMVGADVAFNQERDSRQYTKRAISFVRPYAVNSLEDAQKNFLPGTRITLRGGDPNNVKLVPGQQDLSFTQGAPPNGNP